MTRSTAVEAAELSVSLRSTDILHDLTFDIPTGSITGLLGPSGCGKTTLMRTIVGVQRHTGDLRVLGHPAGSPALRGRIGYVTQSPSLYPELTVADNLRYFATLAGATGTTSDVTDTAEQLGLTPGQRVSTLSGGQRGRASLGCALVGDPDLLVMDEPTVGLDPVVRADLWQRFHSMAERGATLVVSSHVLEEAAQCDRLILLREGRIVWQGTPADLLDRAGTGSYEEAFLAEVRR